MIYDFGFIGTSSVKMGVSLGNGETLKMYNFCISFPIHLKFSPEITHHKIFE